MPRSALIYIFNNEGKLLLQKRSAQEKNYPLHWDFSAGGGIDEGEDALTGAHRELKEEIGIETDLTFLGEERFNEDVLYVYKGFHDGPFVMQEEEVAALQFFSLEEVQEMMESGVGFHPEFLDLFGRYLGSFLRQD